MQTLPGAAMVCRTCCHGSIQHLGSRQREKRELMTTTVANMCARVLAIVAAAPIAFAVTAPAAQADTSDNVYFSYGPGVNCAITGDGTVGCDVSPSRWPNIPATPFPFPLLLVDQVVIDQPWLPAHPGYAHGAFTSPGGNPPMSDVGTFGGGFYGSLEVAHAGASCVANGGPIPGPEFSCSSKGHSFALSSTQAYGDTIRMWS
jgi:hypothetical protein